MPPPQQPHKYPPGCRVSSSRLVRPFLYSPRQHCCCCRPMTVVGVDSTTKETKMVLGSKRSTSPGEHQDDSRRQQPAETKTLIGNGNDNTMKAKQQSSSREPYPLLSSESFASSSRGGSNINTVLSRPIWCCVVLAILLTFCSHEVDATDSLSFFTKIKYQEEECFLIRTPAEAPLRDKTAAASLNTNVTTTTTNKKKQTWLPVLEADFEQMTEENDAERKKYESIYPSYFVAFVMEQSTQNAIFRSEFHAERGRFTLTLKHNSSYWWCMQHADLLADMDGFMDNPTAFFGLSKDIFEEMHIEQISILQYHQRKGSKISSEHRLSVAFSYNVYYELQDDDDDVAEDNKADGDLNAAAATTAADMLKKQNDRMTLLNSMQTKKVGVKFSKEWVLHAKTLQGTLQQMKHHQDYMRVREQDHRKISEATFETLSFWFTVEVLCVMLVATCQVLYFRSFLETKRYY